MYTFLKDLAGTCVNNILRALALRARGFRVCIYPAIAVSKRGVQSWAVHIICRGRKNSWRSSGNKVTTLPNTVYRVFARQVFRALLLLHVLWLLRRLACDYHMDTTFYGTILPPGFSVPLCSIQMCATRATFPQLQAKRLFPGLNSTEFSHLFLHRGHSIKLSLNALYTLYYDTGCHQLQLRLSSTTLWHYLAVSRRPAVRRSSCLPVRK